MRRFVQQIFIPGSRPARPKEDKVVKRLLMSIFACVVVLLAGLVSAQAQTGNRPPCDFSDLFYNDNGLVACTLQSDGSCTTLNSAELNTEPDGRFGTFRQTGPPATGSQVNWVADSTCATNDPTRRNFRILATTGGNADDGNSPFTCADLGDSPACVNQPGVPETLEFIS